jgi:hypothetical protein
MKADASARDGEPKGRLKAGRRCQTTDGTKQRHPPANLKSEAGSG